MKIICLPLLLNFSGYGISDTKKVYISQTRCRIIPNEHVGAQGCPQVIAHSDCAIYSNMLHYLIFQNYCRITVI